MATAIAPFVVFKLVSLIWPIVGDVIKAARADSHQGKKISKREWKQIVEKISERLLSDEVREAVEAMDPE